MNKLLLYIILSVFLSLVFSCEQSKVKQPTLAVKTRTNIPESKVNIETVKEEHWFLSAYFDGIAKDNSIAKYRTLSPTYFGITLSIKEDSISGTGSIWGVRNTPLNLKSDTLAILNVAGKWLLRKKGDTLLLKQYDPINSSLDTITYLYTKRPKIEMEIFAKDTTLSLSERLTNYFNKSLLAGSYKLKDSFVTFKENGELTGLKNFTRYQIHNYFGTLHPYLEKDVVYFFDKGGKSISYNWKFKKNQLVLTDFTYPTKEQYLSNKKKGLSGDYYVLGNSMLVLTKDKKPSYKK